MHLVMNIGKYKCLVFLGYLISSWPCIEDSEELPHIDHSHEFRICTYCSVYSVLCISGVDYVLQNPSLTQDNI